MVHHVPGTTARLDVLRRHREGSVSVEQRLAAFFNSAIERSWDGFDMDGGEIQDLAERLGLIVRQPYDEVQHGSWAREEMGYTGGEPWFVIAPDIAAIPTIPAGDGGGGVMRRSPETPALVSRPRPTEG